MTVVDIDAQDRHFVTGSEDGSARVWDLTTGRAITPLLRHRSRVRNAQFSPDGTRLFVASDGNPTVWTIISPSSPMPSWLPELAELLAHRRWMADESEGAPLTSPPAVLGPGAGVRDLSDWDQWHQWFLSDRLARAHAPGGHVTMQGLSARWFRDLDVGCAHRVAFGHRAGTGGRAREVPSETGGASYTSPPRITSHTTSDSRLASHARLRLRCGS